MNHRELEETLEEVDEGINRLKNSQKHLKYRLHKQFYKEHKKLFKLADILIILAILFNFGAALSTGIIVEKAADVVREVKDPTYTSTVVEANPMVAKNANLETNEEAKGYFNVVLLNVYWWLVIFLWYFYLRLNTRSWSGLVTLLGLTTFFFASLGWNFFNDFGFLLGKAMWEQGFLGT